MSTVNFRNLFKEIKDNQSLKSLYRKLSFENHPDRGGNEENMKKINSLYKEFFEKIKNNTPDDETEEQFETPEFFSNVLSELVLLDGITIELIGSWLWLSGNTFPYREKLRKLSCFWSKSKRKWYWNGEEVKKNIRTHSNIEDLKNRFGCVNIKTKEQILIN